jgi:hypothetical protein
MSTTSRAERSFGEGWERLGRAAEHFARRIARDARKFAEHVEEHTGELARDVAREWSCGRSHRQHGDERPQPDVRHIFDDVRKILGDVIDGIDELVANAFPETSDDTWVRVVSNRDATCGRCGSAIAAGAEAHVRRTAAATEFRCATCGAPDPSTV